MSAGKKARAATHCVADSQKADEKDRKTDHAPLVAATENDEVATLTATIGTNLRRGDLETGVGSLSGDQASSEWEERQKSGAEELVTVHDTVNLETEVEEELQTSRADEIRNRSFRKRQGTVCYAKASGKTDNETLTTIRIYQGVFSRANRRREAAAVLATRTSTVLARSGTTPSPRPMRK